MGVLLKRLNSVPTSIYVTQDISAITVNVMYKAKYSIHDLFVINNHTTVNKFTFFIQLNSVVSIFKIQ